MAENVIENSGERLGKSLIYELDIFSGRVEHFLLSMVFTDLSRRAIIGLGMIAKLTSLVRSSIVLLNSGYQNSANGLISAALATAGTYVKIASDEAQIDLNTDIFTFDDFRVQSDYVKFLARGLHEPKGSFVDVKLQEIEEQRRQMEEFLKQEYGLEKIPPQPSTENDFEEVFGRQMASIQRSLKTPLETNSFSLKSYIKNSGDNWEFYPRDVVTYKLSDALVLFTAYLRSVNVLLDREFPENSPVELTEARDYFSKVLNELLVSHKYLDESV